MAGRDWSPYESATGIDAARVDPDDDECLWTGPCLIETRGKWEGCRDDAQAGLGERVKGDFFLGSLWEFVGAAIKP
jgi:hypothetical protein